MRLAFQPTRGLCRRCGRDAVGLDREFLCEECRTRRPHFDRAMSAVHFEGDARKLINSFKFRNHYWLRDDFVDWLEAAVRAHFKVEEIDAVLPIPATLGHRLSRGFNPCAYLARGLAARLHKPYLGHALRRRGNPARQGSLNEADRRQNIIGTFAVNRSLRRFAPHAEHHTVLVVDDIMTTGSTLSECARTIKEATDLRVFAATLARTVRS